MMLQLVVVSKQEKGEVSTVLIEKMTGGLDSVKEELDKLAGAYASMQFHPAIVKRN